MHRSLGQASGLGQFCDSLRDPIVRRHRLQQLQRPFHRTHTAFFSLVSVWRPCESLFLHHSFHIQFPLTLLFHIMERRFVFRLYHIVSCRCPKSKKSFLLSTHFVILFED